MEILTSKIARMVFAVPFGVFGLLHLINANALAGVVPVWLPGGVVWVYLTGLALLAAAVSLITGLWARYAALLLAALMTIFVLSVHLPGVLNPDTMHMSLVSLLKDVALAGAALITAGMLAEKRTAVSRA